MSGPGLLRSSKPFSLSRQMIEKSIPESLEQRQEFEAIRLIEVFFQMLNEGQKRPPGTFEYCRGRKEIVD